MTEEHRHGERRHADRRHPEDGGRIYILPGWVRIWHWCNALLILTLIATGISLHFAGGKAPLIEFSLAVRIHNVAGLLLVVLYIFFVVANAVTGNWWQFVPRPPGILERCLKQTRFYLWGVFKGETEPYPVTREENFNTLQAITYWFMIYLVMPVLVGSGLIFMFPQFAPGEMFGLDGLLPVAVLHYASACIVLAFLIAHVYLCTFGKKISSTFKTMITGWHEH
ncbi:cytochrome b/b6 domain-containing protein [Uliginosibacterium aquaticum]|uniref:Cytochrome b/b6 domain-containing protein n=1 Tax=Uliginosibacterium aquaticum TaxID=2731212 RepID=A0ABX2INW7_9RHOO|nr:cytochrome b/b6 domain-containing protein [Uliginosibacterium aquaticum]NSL55720.1 cytochrome b/b6 domain-containing protein [Uliginosibacterium aquaticum]